MVGGFSILKKNIEKFKKYLSNKYQKIKLISQKIMIIF